MPQFHNIPENDEWWGDGFTEWTNVKKAKPLYEGHMQPRVPLGGNYYNLLDDNVKIWQADLAKKYGVYGFCYYHYWFNGKMLLEKPMEQMLANKEVDIPFCICWANEPWTKAWVGDERKLLIAQEYGQEEEWKQHFMYLLPFFKDERYITKNGKPLFVFYRPDIVPCMKEMIETWDKLAKENGLSGITFAFQSGDYDWNNSKEAKLFDYDIEFQPPYASHWLYSNDGKIVSALKKCRRLLASWAGKKFGIDLYRYGTAQYKKMTGQTVANYDSMWQKIIEANLFQLFSNANGLTFFHEVRYGFLRIMGTFGQPISYGLYQVFIIALIIYRLKNYTQYSQKHTFLKVAYLLSVINILLTVSRIPIIACILLHILLLYKKSKKEFINYAVAISILLLLLIIFNDTVGMKIPLISDLLSSIGTVTFDNEINSGGVGDRFVLWQWVALSVGNKWLLGKGISTEFAYKVYEWQTKTSIENQYLNVFFHTGVVGVVLLLFSYVAVLVYAKRKNSSCSGSCSFNTIFFSMMLIYFVCELGVQETDLARMYCIWISLLISYNRIDQNNRMEKDL